jgi:hypothetical protein
MMGQAGGSRRDRALVRRRCLRTAFLLSCCAMFSPAGGSASAAAARVAIAIDGAGADDLFPELVEALPAGIGMIETSRMTDVLSRQGIDDVGAAIGDRKRRPALIKKLRKVARAIRADAVMVGTMLGTGRNSPGELQLIVLNASRDEVVLDESVKLKKGAGPRARQLRNLLAVALEGVGGESETEAETAVEEVVQDESTAASREEPAMDDVGSGTSLPEALMVGFGGLDFGGRQFHYNQRITNANLRPYDLPQGPLLPVTPGAAVSLELYPLARMRFAGSRWRVLRDIGVTSHASYNFAKAEVGAVTLKTQWYSWGFSLRIRLHLGERGSSPVVGLEGGVGQLVFAFKDNPTVADILPGVDYHYLRIGADGRFPVKNLSVIVGAAYRRLLNRTGSPGTTVVAAGSVGEHFPRADVAGLDARLGGALPLARNLEARLVLSYIRYWASFHSRPGDTYIAGGALEQMVNADLGIAAFF